MKKLIPFLGFAALALTLSVVNPTPSDANLLCGILPCEGPGGAGGDAPEIDPSAIGSAIALVMGGAAMLSDRFRLRR